MSCLLIIRARVRLYSKLQSPCGLAAGSRVLSFTLGCHSTDKAYICCDHPVTVTAHTPRFVPSRSLPFGSIRSRSDRLPHAFSTMDFCRRPSPAPGTGVLPGDPRGKLELCQHQAWPLCMVACSQERCPFKVCSGHVWREQVSSPRE